MEMTDLNNKYHQQFMQIARDKIALYGATAQLGVVQEELAELITAISHYRRERPGAESEVLSELADVEFMLEQLKMILALKFDFTANYFETSKYFAAGVKMSLKDDLFVDANKKAGRAPLLCPCCGSDDTIEEGIAEHLGFASCSNCCAEWPEDKRNNHVAKPGKKAGENE